MNSCFSSGFREGTQNNETLQAKQLSDIFINHGVGPCCSTLSAQTSVESSEGVSLNFQSYFMLTRNGIISFEFSFHGSGLPSTRRHSKGPSEMCDVCRGDILAGIQLIVHQSGRAATMALTRCTAGR